MPVLIEPGQRAYVPVGAARDLWAFRGPEVLMAGPAGTGKSRACLEKLHACALRFPGMRGLILRKTRESLTQTALVTFEEKVLPLRSPIRLHHQSQEYRYPNGSRIVVGGLDKDTKVMSSEYDLIYVQEATELTATDHGALTTRLRNGIMPYQQLMADCNPSGPDHWLKRRCDSGACLMLESRHEDNPTITPAYLAKLDALEGYQYQRLRLGLWVAAEGMYFTEWDPTQHLMDEVALPGEWPRWTSTDWGFADPWCVLWFCREPTGLRRIFVYRELYAKEVRDDDQARMIADKSAGQRIVAHVGDPSMFNARTAQDKPSIATVYRQQGVNLVPGTNARISGWQTCRRALAWRDHPPRLRVFRSACPNLIRTLPTMVRDPLDGEDLADKIKGQKTEDHAVDALRYGLVAEEDFDKTAGLAEMARTPWTMTRGTGSAAGPANVRDILDRWGKA